LVAIVLLHILGSPARFGEVLAKETARWSKVVQQAGIKIE